MIFQPGFPKCLPKNRVVIKDAIAPMIILDAERLKVNSSQNPNSMIKPIMYFILMT